MLCLVVGISDGDTLTARCDGVQQQVKVRLAEIDAPEKKTALGPAVERIAIRNMLHEEG